MSLQFYILIYNIDAPAHGFTSRVTALWTVLSTTMVSVHRQGLNVVLFSKTLTEQCGKRFPFNNMWLTV